MAATLSIRDYLDHFLFNRDRELSIESRDRLDGTNNQPPPSPGFHDSRLSISKANLASLQNHGIMLAHVYEIVKGEDESIIYSKRIEGQRNSDVYGIFVQDMIGAKSLKASQLYDGRMSRGSSISDISSVGVFDTEEGYLLPGTTISIELLASRSPSNIGSSEILALLEYCKRNSIKCTMSLRFAHAYTWDNKYNRDGLESLHAKSVTLSSVSMSEILQSLFEDLREDLESLTQLQTCRGVIGMDLVLISKAMSMIRQSVTTKSDKYHQEQKEKLRDICQKSEVATYKKYSASDELAAFSIETYRECILLQNSDSEWGKVKVAVTKASNGIAKSQEVYQKLLPRREKVASKTARNLKQKDLEYSLIWSKVGDQVTMSDLSLYDEIVIKVDATISEYTGRVGWIEELTCLHEYLRDRAEDGEIYKVRVETTVKYAHSTAGPIPMSALTKGTSKTISNEMEFITLGFPKGMKVECLHVKDIFLDMVSDMEDSLRHLGSLEYERGSNLNVEGDGLLRAFTNIKRAITITTSGGDYGLSDDFVDDYAEEMNGS